MRKVTIYIISFIFMGALTAFPAKSGFLGEQWRLALSLAGEYLNLEAKVKEDYRSLVASFHGDRTDTKKKFQAAPSIELGAFFYNDYYAGLSLSWHYSDARTKSRASLKFDYFLV